MTAVIVSGGRIEEDFALRFLKNKRYDHIIAADGGLLFLQRHDILPSHIVGDFDSASAAVLEPYQGSETIVIRRFRPEKDWTDTEIAVEQALELGRKLAPITPRVRYVGWDLAHTDKGWIVVEGNFASQSLYQNCDQMGRRYDMAAIVDNLKDLSEIPE